MKKLLLLLLMFVSCCALPLNAATISNGRYFNMRQTICGDYDEEQSSENDNTPNLADTTDDGEGDENNNGADDEFEEDADTTDIFTTGVVVQDIDSLNLTEIDEDFFKKMQGEFLTYIQRVNWETDLNLTPRDTGWLLSMCKYVCKQVAGENDNNLANKTAKKISKALEDCGRKYTCNRVMCLTIEELVRIVEVKNPFILLAVDLDTFKEAIRLEPEVASVYKNMFKFFKDRATMVGGDYTETTKDLLRVSKLGKNNYFNTWKELAQFSQHCKELDSNGLLNPKTEMAAQIKVLEIAMFHLADQTKVKREVAKQLKKNPAIRAAAKELKRKTKRPTRKQRASDYLINNAMTVDEAAKWIRKY